MGILLWLWRKNLQISKPFLILWWAALPLTSFIMRQMTRAMETGLPIDYLLPRLPYLLCPRPGTLSTLLLNYRLGLAHFGLSRKLCSPLHLSWHLFCLCTYLPNVRMIFPGSLVTMTIVAAWLSTGADPSTAPMQTSQHFHCRSPRMSFTCTQVAVATLGQSQRNHLLPSVSPLFLFICVLILPDTHAHTHIYIYIYIHTHTHTHARTHTHIRTHTHASTHARKHTRTHARTQAHIHTHILSLSLLIFLLLNY